VPIFERATRLPFPAEEVFAWHDRPLALERLTPPWEDFRIEERIGGIRDGGEVWIRQKFRGVSVRWHSRHHSYLANRRFVDEAVSGPFPSWVHTHTFESQPGGSVYRDRIEYAFPLGRLGEAFLRGTVRRRLERAFRYRHETVREDLAREASSKAKPRRILISGASGFLGSNLAAFLSTGGHDIHRLVRGRAASPGQVPWDPMAGKIDPAALEGFDAVVHFSGESFERGRWTAAKKARILTSRETSTRFLARTLAGLRKPPAVLLSASAVGFYGNRGEEVLTETAAAGTGFLAEVCRRWEAAAEPAGSIGIRVVHPRIGVVLSPASGYLRRLLPYFRLGLGMRVASGNQWISWVALDDLLYAMQLLLESSLSGPVNVTSPNPTRNADLARTLGRVLHRPAGLPAPASLVGALFGEKGREALLSSTRAVPAKLLAAEFRFSWAPLEDALRRCLGAEPRGKAL